MKSEKSEPKRGSRKPAEIENPGLNPDSWGDVREETQNTFPKIKNLVNHGLASVEFGVDALGYDSARVTMKDDNKTIYYTIEGKEVDELESVLKHNKTSKGFFPEVMDDAEIE